MGFLDIRIEKTERAIKQAFMGLRAEKPVEKSRVKELCARARETYENGKENRKIPVNLRLTVRRGEPVRLSGACAVPGGVTIVMATGDMPEEARNRAVTEEELRQRLTKTGGTVFAADQIEIELDEGLMVSASAVNALRRELLDELAARRTDIPKRRELPASPLPEAPADETPPISGSVSSLVQAAAPTAAGYYLCDTGGRVAVYACNADGPPGALPQLTGIKVNLLPENDVLRIRRGIRVHSLPELQALLEDLGG